jgi:UDP-N-acetylmuramoyl-L-alanyl-D-glutamate--2,6-diaminopimelate ligase
VALGEFSGVPGRLDRIDLPNGAVVFIDFAHTEYALEAVIRALRLGNKGKLITVFGCGGNRDSLKRAPMTRVVNRLSDFTIATSDNPRNELQEDIFRDMKRGIVDDTRITFVPDRRSAILYAVGMSQAGDIILIAGKGHENHQIINGQSLHFDDRAVVLESMPHRNSPDL